MESDLVLLVLWEDHCGLENEPPGWTKLEAERQEYREEAAAVIQQLDNEQKQMHLRE